MMSKKVIYSVYSILFIFSIFIFLIVVNNPNSSFFSKFFYANGGDRFMDYFNSIRDAKNQYVYDEQWVIYPPFINCIFFLISKTLPQNMVQLSFSDRYLMQNNVACLISMIIFFVFCSKYTIIFWFWNCCDFSRITVVTLKNRNGKRSWFELLVLLFLSSRIRDIANASNFYSSIRFCHFFFPLD